ncbi:MAG: aminotransferase class I/II-fold pyridoxal phosphate-dependent enzyme [Gemmatimonadota bacterium]
MKISISDRVKQLPAYTMAGIPTIKRRLIAAGMDVIDLGAGDADGPPPAATVDALREALKVTAMHKYGFQQGLPAFREAAVRWVARRFGQTFDANTEMLPLIGSKEGLSHLASAVCNAGDVVIVPEPGYQAYIGGAVISGAEPYVVPLRPENNFLVELDQLPEAVLRRAKLVYVNYPNNPTAAIAPRDYLERLVASCRKYGIVLAYDNAYSDITFDGYVAPSIFEIPGARDVAIEFFSMSKSFQMTGWRVGFAIGPSELIGALTKLKSYTDTGPFLALQQASAWTLDHAEELNAPVVAELTRRRDAAVEALTEAGFAVTSPKAAMYVWIPLPAGLPSAEFTSRALEEEGVVTLPGSGFGPGGEGFFRIALTVPPERLREAVTRLGRTLAACTAAAGVSDD